MEVPSEHKLDDLPSREIGCGHSRYRVLEKIGEGGHGVVYLAEQQEPVKRRVAVKVVKLGMDTKEVVARFEAERQALALMDHPNIAKVLDAGSTETGRPFFVMELVKGIKITEYCDKHNLTAQERLRLFTQVCHAVHHAHQKGIIHRDIKPSNILVAPLHDGEPMPKVIDFGIAKATAGQVLTDKTVFTAFEQFLGTPAYMSPEQAEMGKLDIDTRSDIYSLGVLLYELLTGRTPFEAKDLVAAGLDEVRRLIREEDPVPPSTRLRKLGSEEQTTLAMRRQCQPRRLVSLVRGDLDWVVMKCLEKDRSRRYGSAEELATDIVRHRNKEPVRARRPSGVYLLKRMAQRNQRRLVSAGLLFAGCVLACLTLYWGIPSHMGTAWHSTAPIGSEIYLSNGALWFIWVQFFVLQTLALDLYFRPNATKRRSQLRTGLYAASGLLQLNFGGLLFFLGITSWVQVPVSWHPEHLLLLPGLSNMCFGGLLLWYVAKEFSSGKRSTLSQVAPGRTSLTLSRGWGGFGIVLVGLSIPVGSSFIHRFPAFETLLYAGGVVGAAGLVVSLRVVWLTRWFQGSLYAPLVLLCLLLSTMAFRAPGVGLESVVTGSILGAVFLAVARVERCSQHRSTLHLFSKHRPRNFVIAAFMVAGLLTIFLSEEHYRGKWKLADHKAAMEATGITLNPSRLWPTASDAGFDFSNRIVAATAGLPPEFLEYAGRVTGIQKITPGVFRRGSQARRPTQANGSSIRTWQELENLIQNTSSVSELKALLNGPPVDLCYSRFELIIQSNTLPNFFNFRLGAQVLHLAALVELRGGRLDEAIQSLTALTRCVKLNSDDPTLVNYMVRVTVVGLIIDAYWDALQAEGWTDLQLERLQVSTQEANLLHQLHRPFEAETTIHLALFESFSGASYESWMARFEPLYKEVYVHLDQPSPWLDVHPVVRLSRQWLFHPIWSFAWADLEQAHYLSAIEPNLHALRTASQGGSYAKLRETIENNRRHYRPPRAGWRFYRELPLLDTLNTPSEVPYPDFRNAQLAAMKHSTLLRILNTAIALKRYEKRYAHFPETIEKLVPEFLSETPLDFMDGHPLRYCLNTNETFTLYSSGEDCIDNGGDLSPPAPSSSYSPWEGKDWVWPHAVNRNSARLESLECADNVRVIEGAKRQWALETGRSEGSMVSMEDLLPYLDEVPRCPTGGLYDPVAVGAACTCSFSGHTLGTSTVQK